MEMKAYGPKTRQDNWHQMKLRELREENQSLKEKITELEERLSASQFIAGYAPFIPKSSAPETLQ